MIVAPQFEHVASVGVTATSCVLLLSRLCLETLCFGCAILLYFLIINNHFKKSFPYSAEGMLLEHIFQGRKGISLLLRLFESLNFTLRIIPHGLRITSAVLMDALHRK